MPEDSSLLLLAGAVGDERAPPAQAGPEPGWHQPLHVRHAHATRRQLAEQVTAGADAIVAPAYWTSRAVLAGYGEARRAAEWTAAAVVVAREAAEAGDGRGVLVCGPINPLVAAEAGAHAEILAEAGADILLVEQMRGVAAARAATAAAAAVGLPVWSGAALTDDGTRLVSGEPVGEWLEAIAPYEPQRLLVYGDMDGVRAGLAEVTQLTRGRVGAVLPSAPSADEATGLLDAGASLLGLVDGAGAEALASLRNALDERLAAQAERQKGARIALQQRLERAASWAPPGAALWLGEPPQLDLPAGFDWSVAPVAHVAQLPEGHFRLLVLEGSDGLARPDQLLRAVEHGGVIVLPAALSEALAGPARVLDAGHDREPAILRRGE